MAGVHEGRLLIEAGLRDPAEQQVLLLDPATGELALADGHGCTPSAPPPGPCC
ncbi:hypothetical protein ABZX75_10445 [Streptomyces sp. NPDC003038]|uniref:hypothetical protein n=1 Tax=unclassified Streptomyces TaxID=2593676 RepID=UPI0033BD1130